MRKTQPFFLQVSPPKSLYWPSSPDEHPPRHHCPIAATSASCCHTPYSHSHHFFASLTSKGVPCFPQFQKSPTAIATSFLPLLNDEDQLFCRTRAAWLSWHTALHQVHYLKIQAQEKLHSPRRAATQDILHEFHPTCWHTDLGFEHTAIATACSS